MSLPLHVVLPRSVDAGAQARRSIERWLEVHEGSLLDDLRIVASEMVNNALLHGRGRIVLEIAPCQRGVRVQVTDEGTGSLPAIRERSGESDAGGWGLRIVEQLAAAWGAGAGVVWAELASSG